MNKIELLVSKFMTNKNVKLVLDEIDNENELIEFLNEMMIEFDKVDENSKDIIKDRIREFIDAMVYDYNDKFKKYIDISEDEYIVKKRLNENFLKDVKAKVKNYNLILGFAYLFFDDSLKSDDLIIAGIKAGNVPTLSKQPSKKVLKAIVTSDDVKIGRLTMEFDESWWDEELVKLFIEKWPEGVAIIPKKFIDNKLLIKFILSKEFNNRAFKHLLKKGIKFNKDIQYLLMVKFGTNDLPITIDKDDYEKIFDELNKKGYAEIYSLKSGIKFELEKIPTNYGKNDLEFIKKLLMTSRFSIDKVKEYFQIKDTDLEKIVDEDFVKTLLNNRSKSVKKIDISFLIEIAKKKKIFSKIDKKEFIQILTFDFSLFPFIIDYMNYEDFKELDKKIDIGGNLKLEFGEKEMKIIYSNKTFVYFLFKKYRDYFNITRFGESYKLSKDKMYIKFLFMFFYVFRGVAIGKLKQISKKVFKQEKLDSDDLIYFIKCMKSKCNGNIPSEEFENDNASDTITDLNSIYNLIEKSYYADILTNIFTKDALVTFEMIGKIKNLKSLDLDIFMKNLDKKDQLVKIFFR
jgi:hypothetical protein